jgi:hypothetical protein
LWLAKTTQSRGSAPAGTSSRAGKAGSPNVTKASESDGWNELPPQSPGETAAPEGLRISVQVKAAPTVWLRRNPPAEDAAAAPAAPSWSCGTSRVCPNFCPASAGNASASRTAVVAAARVTKA